MANERKIRFTTELDISQMLTGINQVKQELNSMGVDPKLFKDVQKDLDKITKEALNINAALKNGVTGKELNPLINSMSNVTKLYSTIPDKIRQISIQTKDIRFSPEVSKRLQEIEVEIDKIGREAKNVLGVELQKSLRNAVPKEIINDKTLENITKATDRIGAFNDKVDSIKAKAADAKQSINDLMTRVVNASGSKSKEDKAIFSNMVNDSLREGKTLDRAGIANLSSSIGINKSDYNELLRLVDEYNKALQQSITLETTKQQIINTITTAEATAAENVKRGAELAQESVDLQNKALTENLNIQNQAANSATQGATKTKTAMDQTANSVQKTNEHIQRQDSLLKQIASRATSLIGIGAIFNYITRGVREAWQGIKELDSEFTKIAVVTDKTTSELWQSFGTYSQMAQRLGVTTKDAVATSALYYQQGLKTADVMTLTAETIKMAQIAGMDFSEATNQMTAAIRGFNLEMSDASKVNDIFSTLAAHAAVSTGELSYALTKTASIADSAGMSIDTTSAFLTKMIETTREAPENIGTAMKSIVARFEELKKNPLSLSVEVDGEEVVANKVEAAIALAGVKLRDTSGQFRDLDQVFLELAKSWEGLDRNTQRYIATIAAGSRQQSRFIAMMDGYDRTLELVELAQDSEGQSAAQFLKTLDSLDSKLNKVKNSFEQLYQKFVDSDLFGGLLTGLNDFLQSLGKMDAGQLASFAIIGVALVNTIINSLKTAIPAFSDIGLTIGKTIGSKISTGVNDRIGNTKVGKFLHGLTPTGRSQKFLDKAKENFDKDINKQKNEIKEKYTVDISQAKKNLSELNNRRKELQTQLSEPQKYNIDVDKTKEELEIVKNKSQKAANTLKNLRETEKQDIENSGLNNKKFEDSDLEKIAKEKAELVSQKTNEAMKAAGRGLVLSLTSAITAALNDGKPEEVLKTGISTLIIGTAPQLLSVFTSTVAGIASKSGKLTGEAFSAGFAATGPGLIIAGVAAALVGLVALISWASNTNKAESKKLQEQLDNLQNKQKELQEKSEKSTAEAAVEKTSYKNLQKLEDEYFELFNKSGRTADENERLAKIIQQIENDFPDLVESYDEAGNAILKQKEQWQEIVELQKQSAIEAQKQAFADKIELSNNRIAIANTTQQLKEITNAEKLRKVEGKDVANFSRDVGISTALNLIPGLGLAANVATLITAFTGGYDKVDAEDVKRTSSKENYWKYLDERGYKYSSKEITNSKGEKVEERTYTGLSEEQQKILESFDDEETKKNAKEIAEATQEQKKIIADYMVNYIKSFSDNEALQDYSDDTLKAYSEQIANNIVDNQEYAMESIIGGMEDVSDFFNKMVKSGVLTEAQASAKRKEWDIEKHLKEAIQQYKTKGFIDWGDLGFSSEEITYYEELINKYIQSLQDDAIKEATKKLEKVVSEMKANEQEKEFNILTNMGAYSKQQVDAIYNNATEEQKEVFQQSKEIYDTKVAELEAFGEGQLKPVIEKYGTDLANYIKQQDLGKAATESIINSLNDLNLNGDEIKGIVGLLSSITDWGDPEQIKRLSEEIYKLTGNADLTVKTIAELRDELLNPMTLNLDADKAVSDMSELAKSLNEVKKGFKDLKSAIEEFEENGRLSGETILNLVENGQLMYLEYDKETKAITINKNAMEEYYEAQLAMVKLRLAEKKQDTLEAIAELEARRQNLLEKRKILVDAYEKEGTLTSEQYEQLAKLNSKFADDTFTIEEAIENGTLNIARDTFVQLEGVTANGFSGLLETIKTNGARIADAMAKAAVGDFSKIDTTITFNAKESKDNIDKFLNSYESKSLVGSVPAEGYIYKYDKTALAEYIKQIDKELEATEASLTAKKKYYELIEKGEDITDAITKSGLDKFLNDTADATKNANKELKEYVSTLEKYYNLQKDIEHLEKSYNKAKTKYEKERTPENQKALEDARLAYGQKLIERRETYKLEKEEDLQRGVQKFINWGLDENTAKQILTLTQNGDLNQKEVREWLAAQGYNEDQGESFEKVWNDVKKEIEEDNKNIEEADDAIESLMEGYDEDIKKIKEELIELDRLKNVEQALDRLNKLIAEAKEDLDAYYESGGREGMDLQQYLHSMGASFGDMDSAQIAYDKVASDLVESNREMLNNYALEVDGEWYLNPDTVGNLDPSGETYQLLEKVLGKLNDIKNKEEELKTTQKNLAKAAKDALKTARQSYSDLVTKAANALAELDQREIDEVKKKYAAIQEEDEKYLTALQKSIDKQRQLRDQAKSYDDLEADEKHLALLERDTSGANAAEIAALREQIKDKRTSLVDTEQDNIVNNIAEGNQNRKDKMDEETQFLQNVMDERTYDMQYYIERAQDIVNAALNGDEGAYRRLLDILQQTDEAFFKGTAEAKQIWLEEFQSTATTAEGYITALKDGTVSILGMTTEEILKKLSEFAKQDIEKISEVEQKMIALEPVIRDLNYTAKFEEMQEAIEKAKKEFIDLVNMLNEKYTTEIELKYKVTEEGSGGSGGKGTPNTENLGKYLVYENTSQKIRGIFDDEKTAKQYTPSGSEASYFKIEGNKEKYADSSKYYVGAEISDFVTQPFKESLKTPEEEKNKEYANKYCTIDNDGQILSEPYDNLLTLNQDSRKGKVPFGTIVYIDENGNILDRTKKEKLGIKVFATGGLVDFTGPAWVDGTTSSPEAFLSAEDTRNIQALTDALRGIILPSTNLSNAEKQEVKSGDTNIEIHIDIDEISDDYDVDQMLDVIQQRISEASEGNVTIVK